MSLIMFKSKALSRDDPCMDGPRPPHISYSCQSMDHRPTNHFFDLPMALNVYNSCLCKGLQCAHRQTYRQSNYYNNPDGNDQIFHYHSLYSPCIWYVIEFQC